MKKGEITYSPKYKFKNGGADDKLLISLNDPLPGEPYLIVLVTSQQKYRKNIPGCHSAQGYYAIPRGIDYFEKPMTWVIFHTLREFALKDELTESWRGNFIGKGFLKETTLRAIINCLKQSDYITKHRASLLR